MTLSVGAGTTLAWIGVAAFVLGSLSPADASDGKAVVDQARAYHETHRGAILNELTALLSIPNVASDLANIEKNAAHVRAMLERRGIAARLLRVDGSPPAVFGRLVIPGATRTLMLYAHYDGQPVDPSRWASDPWVPILRDGPLGDGTQDLPEEAFEGAVEDEWRLFARSASDDKSPIVAMLTALDALRDAGITPSTHLKFFFEGEEEAGSPHLEAILRQHAELLAADAWIFCDGPIHQSRQAQIVFGVRGVVDLEMTVYGPLRSLHSGHYGNWAPNPIALLTELIASMRDGDGNILIAGFYDAVRPPSASEQRAVSEVPPVEEQLRHDLALGATEAGGAPLLERILQPALNLRGFRSGGVESEAKNAIPTEAKASIDFRLVPDQTPAAVRSLVESHVRDQGFTIFSGVPDRATRLRHGKILSLRWGVGYEPLRTSMELPVSKAVIQTVEEALGGPVIKIPTLGGSLPLYLFKNVLDAPLIVLPMVNHDNNQHAPNENLRLGNLWLGVELYAVLMARVGEIW